MLHRLSVERPWTATFLALAVTAAAAPGVARLELRTDGRALVAEGSPEVQFDARIRDEFALEDPLIVLIRTSHPRGIFNADTLRLVNEVGAAIATLEGPPLRVTSLATEPSDRYRTGTLSLAPFLEGFTGRAAEIDRIEESLRSLEIYHGTLVSDDARATAIFVGIPAGCDRVALCRRVAGALDRIPHGEHRIDIIGAAVAESLLGLHILEDLGLPRSLLPVATRAGERGGIAGTGFDQLRGWLGAEIGLVPLVLIVLGIAFALVFRSIAAVVIPLVEAGAAIVFVFGVSGYAGLPVYLTTAVLPVILPTLAIADEIHILTRFARRRRDGAAAKAAAAGAVDEVKRAVVLTALTTAVGFLSFCFSPLAAVRALGLLAAIGIVYCMLFSLGVVPALLVLLSPRTPRTPSPAPRIERWLSAWGRGSGRGRPAAVLVLLLLLLATPVGLRELRVQDSWIDGFAPGSAFREATDDFGRRFLGTHQLHLVISADPVELRAEVDAGRFELHSVKIPVAAFAGDPRLLRECWVEVRREGTGEPFDASGGRRWEGWISAAERHGEEIRLAWTPRSGSPKFFLKLEEGERAVLRVRRRAFLSPLVLAEVRALQERVEGHPELAVGGTLGPPDYLATTAYIARGREPGSFRLPADPPEARSAWLNYARIRGDDRVRQLVDAEFGRGIVTVYLGGANYRDTAELMAVVRAQEEDRLRPLGLAVDFAGDVAVSQSLIPAIVSTQMRSILLSLATILALCAAIARSIRWGLFCVLPSALSIAVVLAAMGGLGIPLGVATSMFAAITLGIGVDHAIHLMEAYRRTGEGPERLPRTLADAGPAILVDGLTVALGFGVLTLSQVPANARLGALSALGLLICLGASIGFGAVLLAPRRSGAAAPAP